MDSARSFSPASGPLPGIRLGPLRVVVVPTDFSGQAGQALPLALALAEHAGAAVHLVHAPPVDGEEVPDQEVRARLSATCMMYRYTLPARASVPMQPVLLPPGPAGEAVGTYARQLGADLVVMASHGRVAPSGGGWRSENAARVVEDALCPVLLVPPAVGPRAEAVGVAPDAPPLLGAWADVLADGLGLPRSTSPRRGAVWVVASMDAADAAVAHGHAGVLVVPPISAGDGAAGRVQALVQR